MSFTGYRVYRGLGGAASVDFDTAVGTAAPGETSVTIEGIGHEPAGSYTYVLRPVLAGRVTPDLACAVDVGFDEAGDWVGSRPAPVRALVARALSGGRIRIQWRPGPADNRPNGEEFAVFVGGAPRVDISGIPTATVAFDGAENHLVELTWPDGQTGYVAVVARISGQAASRPVTIGPVVADAAAPATPQAYADSSF